MRYGHCDTDTGTRALRHWHWHTGTGTRLAEPVRLVHDVRIAVALPGAPRLGTFRMDRAATIAVGDIVITTVWDGTLKASLESILRLDPTEAASLVAGEHHATGVDPLVLPVRAFLIRAGGRIILADTGSGTSKGPTMGHLPRSLAALGVSPGDIDCVLATHLHMDHIGGLIDDAGRPAFPNAELVMHQEEAGYFLDTPEEGIDVRSRRNLDFQRRAVAAYGSHVRRVNDGEGLPGIAARLMPGHTPGHTSWEISAQGKTAVVIGDVIHLGAVQLARPSSAMIYDVDAGRAAQTRVGLLARLAGEGSFVAGAHLPAGGLGRIVAAGEGYRFVPS